MRLKIGIYIGLDMNKIWDENNYLSGGIGGSEVWAIRTSDELAKMGHDVYLFAFPEKPHISNTGVKYFQRRDFYFYSTHTDFDAIIISRCLPVMIEKIRCNNIFIMAHDLELYNADLAIDLIKTGKIKKIFCLSEFHKQSLINRHPFLNENIFSYTRNGIDTWLYDKFDGVEKKNKMLCSSGPYRQGIWIARNIFPLIKKEVPDFEMNLCHYYDSFDNEVFKQEGINIIAQPGSPISKEDLVREQCESKIWVYSNNMIWDLGYATGYFNETFCITALEDAYAKCAIIAGKRSPFTETLSGYSHFVGENLYPNSLFEMMPSENCEEFARMLANEAIRCLKDENYRLELVKESYEIAKNSTWENATSLIENELVKYF